MFTPRPDVPRTSNLLGEKLQKSLDELALQAEAEMPGAMAGFTVLSKSVAAIKSAIFPSLPLSFENAIANAVIALPFVGTCAAAICEGNPASSADLDTEERFDSRWRQLCIQSGIKAIRSVPLIDPRGKPCGTFTLAFAAPVSPDGWSEALMEKYARLGAAAVELYLT